MSQDAAVTALNEKLRAVKREQFKYLAGQGITVTDGAKKYGVHRTTILNWIRHGYITALKTGYRQVVDEADLAYCFAIYDLRKRHDALFGAPLLDEDRLPYIIKHPFLSEQRRKERL